jgi:serine/threonine-protein kinase
MLSAVTLSVETSYQIRRHVAPSLHLQALAILALWALASVLLQQFVRRGARLGPVRFAWAGTDVALLTVELMLTGAGGTVLVSSYLLLVVGAGLWFRAPLVWFTTVLAEVGYGVLLLDCLSRGTDVGPLEYQIIFMATLVILGFTIAHQVRRVRALSSYFENRP